MLFADAEFLKPPNVVEVFGLLLALASIWLSWFLAKRDIARKIVEAEQRVTAASEVQLRRFEAAILRTSLFAIIRSLELARESCRGRNWPRSCELCELARDQLGYLMAQKGFAGSVRREVEELPGVLVDCIRCLRRQPKRGTGQIPEEVHRALDDSIHALHCVDGRITTSATEDHRG
jgi:hypothetical protein